jgi:hypothetical protein
MGCCGKARANLSVSRAAIARTPTPVSGASPETVGRMHPLPIVVGNTPTQLRYSGTSNIVVRGPATGRSYIFSHAEPVRTVDRRDAAVLLRTHYFRQA